MRQDAFGRLVETPTVPRVLLRAPARWNVLFDHGPVGIGVSEAHHVTADNQREYIMKGPVFTPTHPYVAANELIAVTLAGLLDLPVLPHCFLDLGASLFFGSEWMTKGTGDLQLTADTFRLCDNQEKVYDLVAFDVWLCNIDRHAHNFIVRRHRTKVPGQQRLEMLLNDHSHCLLPPRVPIGELALRTYLPVGPNVKLPFLRDAILDGRRLSRAIGAIERLGDDTIRQVVDQTPVQWLGVAERTPVVRFLSERRGLLRRAFEVSRADFRGLKGGPL